MGGKVGSRKRIVRLRLGETGVQTVQYPSVGREKSWDHIMIVLYLGSLTLNTSVIRYGVLSPNKYSCATN